MASIKATGGPNAGLFRGQDQILRKLKGGGWVLQRGHPCRTLTIANLLFRGFVRDLARGPYADLTPLKRTQWKDPFGPSAWTRHGSLVKAANSWTCFVAAHLGEYFYRGHYIESSPSTMLNNIDDIALQYINWDTRAFSLNLTLHWYTTPGPETALELYQINPIHVGSPKQLYFTRRILTWTGVDYPETWYVISGTFAWPVKVGQVLRLFGRLRTTGGHDQGTITSANR